MNSKFFNWFIFILLCIVWGSSFMLMKRGMFSDSGEKTLSAFQVGAIRILSAGLVLLPVFLYQLKKMDKAKFKYMLLSGLLGNFFPAFLFCIAELKIDSALAGALNSLTPIFVILTGIVVFKNRVGKNKIAGVVIGLLGCFLLFISDGNKDIGNIYYALLIVLATLCYGMNVNMVHRYLLGIPSLQIATVSLVSLIIPSCIVLWLTGYFNLPLYDNKYTVSSISSIVLGVMGTAFASIIFFMLVKRAGAVFSSLVTYGIPFVAIFWGIVLQNETVSLLKWISLFIILSGVYIANRK